MIQVKSIVISNYFVKLKLSKQAVKTVTQKVIKRQLRLDI